MIFQKIAAQLADGSVNGQSTFRCRDSDAEGGIGFGRRTAAEDCIRGDRKASLCIAHTVSLNERNLAVLDDTKGETGRVSVSSLE